MEAGSRHGFDRLAEEDPGSLTAARQSTTPARTSGSVSFFRTARHDEGATHNPRAVLFGLLAQMFEYLISNIDNLRGAVFLPQFIVAFARS